MTTFLDRAATVLDGIAAKVGLEELVRPAWFGGRGGQEPDEASLKFLHVLAVRDIKQRAKALEDISRRLDGWVSGVGSPSSDSGSLLSGMVGEEGLSGMVRAQIPRLLGLSCTCPLADVRLGCIRILDDLKDQGFKIPRRRYPGPSTYVPVEQVVPIDTDDTETAALFTDIYLRQARLDNIVQMIGYHPRYLDAFKQMKERLMFEDGPLPLAHRNYIAIMGASRHRCEYLACAHAREFALAGGNEDWLQGLNKAPRKLQVLDELNKVMAHTPWLLNTQHFQALLQSGDGEERWSQSELMQAVVILAHTHALCSFVFGLGLTPEIDDPQGHTFEPAADENQNGSHAEDKADDVSPGIEESSPLDTSKPPPGDDIPKLIARMEELKRLPEPSEEEQARNFEALCEDGRSGPDSPDPIHNMAPAVDVRLERFVFDPGYGYKDFYDKTEGASDTLRVQDYSWDRDGIIMCNDLYQDMGDLLDKKFQVSESLTYNTMGDQNQIDTTAFRQALLRYADCMFGIRHDDYNYTKMHTLLDRRLKAFTKAVVCSPERITAQDRDNFIPALKFSEKVHIQLMLLESRLRAELLYALRQLNEIRR